MKHWYASVNYGLEAIVASIIKTYGAKNIKTMDSAVTFSCESEIEIKCINNLFVVLSSFRCENIAEAAKRAAGLAFSFPQVTGKSFRVIVMDCGKLRAIPPSGMAEIERNISRQSKLVVHRAKPDIEVWLNRRNDGATFFMVRTKKHASFDKSLKQGELRPDVVDIMLHSAKIRKHGVIADLFGGWGAIAAAAAESGRCKKIYTGDIDVECVRYQKARLRRWSNCVAQKWDARRLPLEDASVDSVVTDPPWGEYAEIEAQQFYDEFLREAARILRADGSLVFLSSAESEARQSLEKHGFSYSRTPLKIGGKNAFLFCAERKKEHIASRRP